MWYLRFFDPRMSFDYIQLLRANCLKNFKELTKQITVDKAMLFYLNGNQNTNLALMKTMHVN